MPRSWVIKQGWEPIAEIGRGPLGDAEFKALWKAYRERGGWGAKDAPLGGAIYEQAGETDIAAAEGPPASPDAAASLADEED